MQTLNQQLENIQLELNRIKVTYQNLKEQEFDLQMQLIHPNIAHGKYESGNKKVHCHCTICDHSWDSTPHNLLRLDSPRGCPKCAGNVALTPQEILNKLVEKFPNINILTDINNIKIREMILYKLDGDIIYQNHPNSMLKDGFNNFKRYWNEEIYKEELSKINPNIICVDAFVNMKTKIKHYCNIHKCTFEIDPQHALRGQGCTQCKSQKIGDSHRKPLNQYLKELHLRTDNIELIGDYNGFCKPAEHRCKKCGYRWYSLPQNIIKYSSCPSCNRSKGEAYISSFLDNLNINYEREFRIDDCKDKRALPFDFAIKNFDGILEFLIEYQGKQHYTPSQFGNITLEQAQNNLKECQKRDKIKSSYCDKNEIDLLVIDYRDFDKIDEIITNKLIEKGLIKT